MKTLGLPTPAVRDSSAAVFVRANMFGAGRTMGYYATPDAVGHAG